jgi:hypothetical protein
MVFFRVFSVPKNGLERIFVGFLFQKMVRNVILKFFLFRKWFGIEFRVFSLPKMVGTEFQGFSLPKIVWNGIPKFFLSENGSEWNFKSFSLPRNGLERNSEVFLFRETGGILTELQSVSSCSVFRGIIFLSENGNPSCGGVGGSEILSVTTIRFAPIRFVHVPL